MAELLFPKEYEYVVLELVLNFWMSQQVSDARKKFKVFYPTLYASESENKDAKYLNCVQDIGTLLEMMPMSFILMIVGGIRHHLGCAAFGSLYVVSRFFYFKGRMLSWLVTNYSKYGFLALFGLMISAMSCGVRLLREGGGSRVSTVIWWG